MEDYVYNLFIVSKYDGYDFHASFTSEELATEYCINFFGEKPDMTHEDQYQTIIKEKLNPIAKEDEPIQP